MDRFFTSFRMTSEKTKSSLLLYNILQIQNSHKASLGSLIRALTRGNSVALHITYRVFPKSGYYIHLIPYFGNTLFFEVSTLQRTTFTLTL